MENCNCAPASCGCQDKLPAPSPEAGLHLAIAAIPMQCWETPYDQASALHQGTIFPSLDMPFFVTDNGAKLAAPNSKGGEKLAKP